MSGVRVPHRPLARLVDQSCQRVFSSEGLLSPRLNTAVVNVFLEEFSRTLRDDEYAVMIWDDAGFHTSKQLRLPDLPDRRMTAKIRYYAHGFSPLVSYQVGS